MASGVLFMAEFFLYLISKVYRWWIFCYHIYNNSSQLSTDILFAYLFCEGELLWIDNGVVALIFSSTMNETNFLTRLHRNHITTEKFFSRNAIVLSAAIKITYQCCIDFFAVVCFCLFVILHHQPQSQK